MSSIVSWSNPVVIVALSNFNSVNIFATATGRINQEGLTIIPTKMYFFRGKVKIEIAVAKGKKLYDKRQVKKKRDWNREKARLMSRNNKWYI